MRYRGLLLLTLSAAATAAPALEALRALAPASPGVVFVKRPLKRAAGRGSTIELLDWSDKTRTLSADFESAVDPEISYDATRILFAARPSAAAPRQIFEMDLASGRSRQLTRMSGDCRRPAYQSRIFNLEVQQPWDQVVFSSEGSLWTVKLDGSGLQRITWTPSEDSSPVVLPDGRVVYSSRQGNRAALFGVNLDGTDYALFAFPGLKAPESPSFTGTRRVVFVEGGQLISVNIDRPMHSRYVLTAAAGVFETPFGLEDGSVLAARRQAPSGPSSLWRVDTKGALTQLLADPSADLSQPVLVAPRPLPDGRGSVVDLKDSTAKVYCLSVYTGDEASARRVPPGSAKRLRVLEAVPAWKTADPLSDQVPSRLLGEIDLEADGSFQIQVPANTPMKVQVLDADGFARRSSAWFYARNKETRGCIGCHEDRELTPENRLADALNRKAPALTLPPERRRRVDFSADVAPLLERTCATSGCHDPRARLRLDARGLTATALKPLVRPGEARLSPLLTPARHAKMPLSTPERRTLIEWIDMGAHWNSPPAGGQP